MSRVPHRENSEETVMSWIRTVGEDEARGRLRTIYDAAVKRAGRVFGIVKVQSLEPHVLDASMAIYRATTLDPRSPLTRAFRELVGVHVSRLNGCEY
jgi:alkylhydroperoxidase family enzyme